jgi:hypothetical protein
VSGNWLFSHSLRFWQPPQCCMSVPSALSRTLAMGWAIRSTRSPKPVGLGGSITSGLGGL